MYGLFSMATESVNFGGIDSVPLDYATESEINSYPDDDLGFGFFMAENYREYANAEANLIAMEGAYAIKYMQATTESAREYVSEGFADTLKNFWETIKKYIKKAWAYVKKYAKKAYAILKKRFLVAKSMLTDYRSTIANLSISSDVTFKWASVHLDSVRTHYDGDINEVNSVIGRLISKVSKAKANKNQASDDDLNAIMTKVHGQDIATKTKEYYSWLYTNTGNSQATSPQYEEKHWSDIGADAVRWADTDASQELQNAVHTYDKDVDKIYKDIEKAEKSYKNDLREVDTTTTTKAGKTKVKNPNITDAQQSKAVKYIKKAASHGISLANVYIGCMKHGIEVQQGQAIAACRKAIKAKGTKSATESFDFGIMI